MGRSDVMRSRQWSCILCRATRRFLATTPGRRNLSCIMAVIAVPAMDRSQATRTTLRRPQRAFRASGGAVVVAALAGRTSATSRGDGSLFPWSLACQAAARSGGGPVGTSTLASFATTTDAKAPRPRRCQRPCASRRERSPSPPRQLGDARVRGPGARRCGPPRASQRLERHCPHT